MSRIQSGLGVRVEQGQGDGSRASVVITGPLQQPVDVTEPLVGAVAHSLWLARGGDSLENWADAEDLVQQLLTGRAEGARPRRQAAGSLDGEAIPGVPAPVAARRQSARR